MVCDIPQNNIDMGSFFDVVDKNHILSVAKRWYFL